MRWKDSQEHVESWEPKGTTGDVNSHLSDTAKCWEVMLGNPVPGDLPAVGETATPGEGSSSVEKEFTSMRSRYKQSSSVKYALREGVRACPRDEQHGGVRIGWSYSWSFSRGWNIH